MRMLWEVTIELLALTAFVTAIALWSDWMTR
jgi:hypothetical protein